MDPIAVSKRTTVSKVLLSVGAWNVILTNVLAMLKASKQHNSNYVLD